LPEVSLAQQRVLLTRDRGLLHRRALRWGAHVSHDVADEQLREVLDRFAPPLYPWTWCLTCNGMLAGVAKSEVQELLPAGTRRCYDTFAVATAAGGSTGTGPTGTGCDASSMPRPGDGRPGVGLPAP
jgi:uncharacterized protein with PIN domain